MGGVGLDTDRMAIVYLGGVKWRIARAPTYAPLLRLGESDTEALRRGDAQDQHWFLSICDFRHGRLGFKLESDVFGTAFFVEYDMPQQ